MVLDLGLRIHWGVERRKKDVELQWKTIKSNLITTAYLFVRNKKRWVTTLVEEDNHESQKFKTGFS